MTTDNSYTITIPLKAYNELVSAGSRYRMLIERLFEVAKLSYDDTHLTVDDYHGIDSLIKAFQPEMYSTTLNHLKAEKARKEAEKEKAEKEKAEKEQAEKEEAKDKEAEGGEEE